MPEIVISEFMDAAAVDRLRQVRNGLLYDPGLVDRPAELRAALVDARALIVRNRTQVEADLLRSAPGLHVLGRLGVGLDNIDVTECRDRRITVIPATGANADAVSEYVILAVGMLLRGAFLVSGSVAAGEWPRARLASGREMGGKTLGLVGFGGIGQRTAQRAVALGMRVLAHDPLLSLDSPAFAATGAERVAEFDALIARADAVSLHVPLTPETHGLLSAARIAHMRPNAVLVNTARGGIVDEAALAAALKEGRLAGAALDVFEEEPLPAGSPLAGAPNLVLTPHVAGVTAESNERVSALIAERVLAALDGAGL